MKKTTQTAASSSRGKKLQTESPKTSTVVNDEDDWEGELGDSSDVEVAWLEIAAREKETSRIRRQMEARRELEKRLEEKRLRDLVEDWAF